MKRPVAVWKAHEGAILTVKGRDFFDDGGYEGHIFTYVLHFLYYILVNYYDG